ncbi:MAG: DEAD/DEAH box helicase family protein [Coriobacteriia bacterium]|nr:DEAD/DEAH box helicase family protein [Coriobacteriia bacterium]
MTDTPFLDERRLLYGPWQAFERDVARVLLASGFEDVRVVGGSGDHGADVLAVRNGQLWIVQCKYTSGSSPPSSAVTEIVEAGRFYGADRLAVAVSRPPSDAMRDEVERYRRAGLKVEVLEPTTLLELARRAQQYAPARRELRTYQTEACSQAYESLVDTGRALAVLATGLGKTVVMAALVAELTAEGRLPHGRVLVLAHTRPLVDQLHRSFWYQLPKTVPTHQLCDGEEPAHWNGVIFATWQSLIRRIARIPDIDMVLVDEAHHVGENEYRDLIAALDPPLLVGVTATPWRGDGFEIERVFGAPVVRIDIAEGLSRGFLCEVDYRLLADDIDWEFVQQASAHHYSVKQLNSKLLIPTRDEQAAQAIVNCFRNEARRSGLVFSKSIEHAEYFAGVLRTYGLRAESLSAATLPREREVVLARFRAGHTDILATVDLFNEGMDVPDVDLVAFMRVTHSRRIFVQQIGRGLRVSADKDKVIVLDFVSDLRRVAAVVDLDSSTRSGQVEKLGLGPRLVSFADQSAGAFMREWMLDQASLFAREGDPDLIMPDLEFPSIPAGGAIQ